MCKAHRDTSEISKLLLLQKNSELSIDSGGVNIY